MCELLGLSFSEPLSADFSIRKFSLRAAENADGWGLAWYPDRSLAFVKEALDWRKSAYSQFLETYPGLRSKIYVAHVRHRTTGGFATYADTHPFERELGGRHFVFAHNGTIQDFEKLPLVRFHPIGETDSERIFCHLLDLLAERGPTLDEPSTWHALHRLLKDLNRRGTINCLLSDGQRLFAYHDAAGWKGLSIKTVQFGEHPERQLEDATVKIALGTDTPNRGMVVATAPLDDHGWRKLQPAQLVVLENGRMVYLSEVSPEPVQQNVVRVS